MKPIFLCILLLALTYSGSASAVICCKTEPSRHWRSIDGRKCYTDRYRPKRELRWCGPKAPRGERTEPSDCMNCRAPRGARWGTGDPLPMPREEPIPTDRPLEDPPHVADPPPAFDPEPTMRALSDLRRIEATNNQPRTIPGPLPIQPKPADEPRTSTTFPAGKSSFDPKNPGPAWSGLLPFLLALFLLGTAATEDTL